MFNNLWLKSTLLAVLLAALVAGIIIAYARYVSSLPVEISFNSPTSPGGTVYIGGGVSVPGYYSFYSEDTINDLIQAAGGCDDQADLSSMALYIPLANEDHTQKIDINRADAWLLQALPGIGETLARRIIDYRLQNGPFPDINSIMKISGIGENEFNRIKNLITVSGR